MSEQIEETDKPGRDGPRCEQRLVRPYDREHIASKLQAMSEGGSAYYGNELHSAKDLLVDYPEQRDAILRWLVGRQRDTDHIRLSEAAMILRGNYSPNSAIRCHSDDSTKTNTI
jgi:hypothetical protein